MFKNITVIGSGLMDSAIAAHLANVGCKVNLLDIIDKKNNNKIPEKKSIVCLANLLLLQ